MMVRIEIVGRHVGNGKGLGAMQNYRNFFRRRIATIR